MAERKSSRVYFISVFLLMGLFPVLSILIDTLKNSSPDLILIIGKWFVFWAAGVRLLVAGLRQALQPSFTAEGIFKVKDPGAQDIVREVGFGNISIGIASVLSLGFQSWLVPCALIAGLYYGLAGLVHINRPERNAMEQTALVSDLVMFVILGGFFLIRVF
jgi:hypothetical protein